MPNALTSAQLDSAKTMIDQGNGYANLAKGVVECTTLTGGSTAQNFMTQSAATQGVTLTATQVANIEIGMAKVYFDSLKTVADVKGYVNEDWSYKAALAGHSAVFKDNQLGPQT